VRNGHKRGELGKFPNLTGSVSAIQLLRAREPTILTLMKDSLFFVRDRAVSYAGSIFLEGVSAEYFRDHLRVGDFKKQFKKEMWYLMLTILIPVPHDSHIRFDVTLFFCSLTYPFADAVRVDPTPCVHQA
jgi:hypothetical protein